jgi:TPR repeat protein
MRMRFVRRATHRNNQTLLDLMNELYFYKKGRRSRSQALALAKLLGKAGEYAAYRLVAASYDWGTGVRRDTKQALHYWKKAASLGDAYSQASLAYAYDKGLGTRRDLRRARYWYRKATAGNADAQYNLAQMGKFGRQRVTRVSNSA